MINCAQCGKEINTKKKDYRLYKYVKKKKGKLKTRYFCSVNCITRWRILRLQRFKSLDKSVEKAVKEADKALMEEVQDLVDAEEKLNEVEKPIAANLADFKKSSKEETYNFENDYRRNQEKDIPKTRYIEIEQKDENKEYKLEPVRIDPMVKTHFGLKTINYDDVGWDKDYVIARNTTKKQIEKKKQDTFKDQYDSKYGKRKR